MTSRIVKTATRIAFPFILLFGMYIIIFGHLSPGGGFQGGVILGMAVLLIVITLGSGKIKRLSTHITFIETLAMVLIVLIGCIGLAFGVAFLSNILPKGALGTLLSSGIIPFFNLAIGMKVFAGIVILYLILVQMGREK